MSKGVAILYRGNSDRIANSIYAAVLEHKAINKPIQVSDACFLGKVESEVYITSVARKINEEGLHVISIEFKGDIKVAPEVVNFTIDINTKRGL